MRKRLSIVSLAILILMAMATVSYAANVNVIVNGNAVRFPDALPYINVDGRTMVPVRFISEQLGAKVNWDQAHQTVEIDYNGIKISCPVNQKVAMINGKQIQLDTNAVIKGNRTMVPLRFVSEALGANVLWAQSISTVRISTSNIDLTSTLAKNNKYQSMPTMSIDPQKTYLAEVQTNRGNFSIQLLASKAPLTVNNFVFLAREHFYDGVLFHRIMRDFMIQTGDPSGSGAGGPGYDFADELPPAIPYAPGVVAMANSGPNTNGSQFFICTGEDLRNLNSHPAYTVFGQISEGMETVLKISDTPLQANGRGEVSLPMEDVYIESIVITEQ